MLHRSLVPLLLLVSASAQTRSPQVQAAATMTAKFCLCDANAPCGNEDPAAGCINAMGHGTLMSAVGTTSISADDLSLRVTQLPQGLGGSDPTLLLASMRTSGPKPLFSGVYCLGEPMYRFQIGVSLTVDVIEFGPIVGDSIHPPTWAGMPAIEAGQQWYFQSWTRDPGGPCGPWNFTNGVSALFVP